MNFDFSEDQKLLRKTAREFLSEHAPLSLCRAVLESDASYSDTLWKATAELGWRPWVSFEEGDPEAPPPRSIVPPLPWKNRSLTPHSSASRDSPFCAR